jgi:hypothetical protein
MSALTDEQRELALRRVRSNLLVHAAHCAKIKDKQGRVTPFLLNRAQMYVHEQLEKQKAETGMVRALVLKGRQQGISTYIGERFYHQVTTQGKSAFIVAHEDKATSNLFEMVKRYQEHNPLAPSTKASNAKELLFGAIDAGYKLATAGTDDVGRGNTGQMIHGSEFAFWRNPQMHLAGLGNTVADMPGSEIILESTGNGQGNAFHLMWQEAEAGNNGFIAIFVPWYWQEEYRMPLRAKFELSAEDEKYMLAYGLDLEQMQWRANKIAQYGKGFEWLFDQEYPATAALAFQSSTLNPLISPSDVMSGVNSRYMDQVGPLIVGVDPAGDGVNDPDRTAFVFRRGRVVPRVEYHKSKNTMQIVGMLVNIWNNERPDAIIIDKGGLGAGVVDRLQEMNVPVIGINNAERDIEPDTYENIRAGMWWRMKDWFENAPVRLPNDAALISDITAPQPDEHSSGRKLLESKKKMAKRGIRSPDGGDALALTFAVPVAKRQDMVGGFAIVNGPREAATTAGY